MDLAVLALDPGTKVGFACSDGRSGAIDLALKKESGHAPSRHGALARRFRHWLDAELFRSQAGVLVLEQQMMHRGGGLVTLGLRMVALELASGRGVLVDEVQPSTWMSWSRKAGIWCKEGKGDEADARAMLAWWTAVRAPKVC